MIRFVLLLLVGLGVLALTLQNLTPPLTLIFLGVPVVSLPLGLLILGAIAAGMLTGLTLLAVLRLASYLTWRQFQQAQSQIGGTQPEPAGPTPVGAGSPTDEEDEWWNVEPEQHPISGGQSGSSYSYVYRESRRAEEGPVYDADFRVIKPPRQSTSPAEDDDFDFDFNDQPPPRR